VWLRERPRPFGCCCGCLAWFRRRRCCCTAAALDADAHFHCCAGCSSCCLVWGAPACSCSCSCCSRCRAVALAWPHIRVAGLCWWLHAQQLRCEVHRRVEQCSEAAGGSCAQKRGWGLRPDKHAHSLLSSTPEVSHAPRVRQALPAGALLRLSSGTTAVAHSDPATSAPAGGACRCCRCRRLHTRRQQQR
jgi:hypothetical protein